MKARRILWYEEEIKMKKILISRCLMGDCCRYDGKSNLVPEIRELAESGLAVPVCPEQLGGLPTPRTPSEICGDRVMMRDGTDVTENFRRGAERALAIGLEQGCVCAVTKAKSPSCGCGRVYDGTFSGTLVSGDGIFVRLLKEAGILVCTEKDDWQALISETGLQGTE